MTTPELLKTALTQLRENKVVRVRRLSYTDWNKCRIETAMGKYLQIGIPIVKGRLMPMRVGDNVEVGFSHREDFVTFSGHTLAVQRRPVPLFSVLRPTLDELRVLQRRTAPRVDSLVPLSYELDGGQGLLSRFNTLALNLSLTGLAFNTPHPITPKSSLRVDIQIPDSTGDISMPASVVSCSRVMGTPEERYKIRVRFIKMLTIHQERLKQFILARQHSMKRMDQGGE